MRKTADLGANIGYLLMVLTYRIQDVFGKPGAILHEFGIKPGDTVVDFGCGPGRYLETASALVGEDGKVYAVDIQPTAIGIVARMAARRKLANVIPVLSDGGKTTIPDSCADLVYALDMFHRVDEPVPFLAEIRRIVKDGSRFILEDGHQGREATRKKLNMSDLWAVEDENERYLLMKPMGGIDPRT